MKDEIRISIDRKQVAYLLASAFEGGSNYWYRIEKYIKPTQANLRAHMSFSGDNIFPTIDYPLCKGGALLVSDYHGVDGDESSMKVVRLDWSCCLEGLRIMSVKYPQHFANWLSGNDDATTADVFLQCALFGEVIYG